MYSCTTHTNYSDLNDCLYQLWWYNIEGIPPQGEHAYNLVYNKFIGKLVSDVDVAISFFQTLNMDKAVDSYAMSFVGAITEKLETYDEKTKFEKFISTLSQKYPNSSYVDWRAYQFNDSSSSLDDESLSDDSDAESTDGEDKCD